jgi:hypothetical protein
MPEQRWSPRLAPGWNSPIMSNDDRADRADTAVRVYDGRDMEYPANADQVISDMLSDLRHLCDRLELDWSEMTRRGRIHYFDELAAEASGGVTIYPDEGTG